ncbi:MAG TPA: hypothetical protein VN253_28490 [Kofleriaceae bacterium]|nr:hypothetical protein [Kofleriaceae bacterium]
MGKVGDIASPQGAPRPGAAGQDGAVGKATLVGAPQPGAPSHQGAVGKATPVGAPQSGHATGSATLDELRRVVAAHGSDAIYIYRNLDRNARAALRGDPQLIAALLRLTDGLTAAATLRELALERKVALEIAAHARPNDPMFLHEVLRVFHLDNLHDLTAAASDFANAHAFVPLLGPIIAGPTATAKLQLHLATTPNGTVLMRLAFGDQPLIWALPKLAQDGALLLEGLKANADFADWILRRPADVEAVVVAGHDQVAWLRALFGGPHQDVLFGWLSRNKPVWGKALVGPMQQPSAKDLAAVKAHVGLGWAMFDAIATVAPPETVLAVFTAFHLSLIDKIQTFFQINRLDDHAVQLVVGAKHVTAAELEALAVDQARIKMVRGAAKGKRPSQVMPVLAHAPALFCEAVGRGGEFAAWVTESPATLIAEMKAVNAPAAWLVALQATNNAKAVLAAAGDAALLAPLRQALVAANAWGWLFTKLPQPVPTQHDVETVFALYGEGAGIGLPEHYAMWKALYHTPLDRKGNDYVERGNESPNATFERRYIGVDPSLTTMQGFYRIYRLLPRTHIDTATAVLFCRIVTYKRTTTKPDRTVVVDYYKPGTPPTYVPTLVEIEMGPSFYGADNRVMMKATSDAGAKDDSLIQRNYVGQPGEAAGAVNKLEGQATAMTYFQNHATHEVGHAVAARTLHRGKYNENGNDFARRYGQWKDDGKAIDYARMLEFTTAMDGHDYAVTAGLRVKTYRGAKIREFLTGIAEQGLKAQDTHPIAVDFGGADAALSALQSARGLAGNLLVETVVALKAQLPGGGWQFPNGIGGATARVTMRADGKWQTYHASVWRNRVSHYSLYSVGENFAEMYTAHYASKTTPPDIDGVSIGDYFTELTNASPSELGLPAAKGGKAPGAEAPSSGGGPEAPNHRPFP